MHRYPTCSIPGCDRIHKARGMCVMHYARWRRHGDPFLAQRKVVLGSIMERYWARVVVGSEGECWGWTGPVDRAGYGYLTRSGKSVLTHRLSWEWHNGPIQEGLNVCHSCDNPPCTNPAHLFLGTPRDNTQDAVAKGRMAHGERQGSAKLTAADVLAIRSRYALGGISMSALGRAYGVNASNIYYIVRRVTWNHI